VRAAVRLPRSPGSAGLAPVRGAGDAGGIPGEGRRSPAPESRLCRAGPAAPPESRRRQPVAGGTSPPPRTAVTAVIPDGSRTARGGRSRSGIQYALRFARGVPDVAEASVGNAEPGFAGLCRRCGRLPGVTARRGRPPPTSRCPRGAGPHSGRPGTAGTPPGSGAPSPLTRRRRPERGPRGAAAAFRPARQSRDSARERRAFPAHPTPPPRTWPPGRGGAQRSPAEPGLRQGAARLPRSLSAAAQNVAPGGPRDTLLDLGGSESELAELLGRRAHLPRPSSPEEGSRRQYARTLQRACLEVAPPVAERKGTLRPEKPPGGRTPGRLQ